jgi:hypothetical protein
MPEKEERNHVAISPDGSIVAKFNPGKTYIRTFLLKNRIKR